MYVKYPCIEAESSIIHNALFEFNFRSVSEKNDVTVNHIIIIRSMQDTIPLTVYHCPSGICGKHYLFYKGIIGQNRAAKHFPYHNM